MSNSTDALFQAWIQFIDATFTGGGWVNTADTGQLTLASAAHPTAIQTKVGYRIYRMDDALQATSPVFVKVYFGSGNTANVPSLWLVIGTGSDGSGNITGAVYNDSARSAGTIEANTTGTNACNSYGSADKNRIQLLMFVRAGANDAMPFSLERTKDSSCNDTGTGLLMVMTGINSSGGAVMAQTAVILLAGGGQPPVEFGVSMILSNQASSAFASDVGIGLPIFFAGVAQPCGLGCIAVNSGDFLAEGSVSFSIGGNTHNFQLSNSSTSQLFLPTGNGAGTTARANTRIGIRYE